MKESTKGVLLTIAGAITWGLSGTCGQYLMSVGNVNPIWLTSTRMLCGGLILSLIALKKRPQKFKELMHSKRDLLQLTIFGIFGLLFSQLAYLITISKTNAGTATVLQYLCPIIIIFYASIKKRSLPTKIELGAIALAILGTFLLATHGSIHELAITPSGLAWGITTAFAYSLYMILPDELIHKWDSVTITGLGLLIGGIVCTLFSRPWQYQVVWTPMVILTLFGIIFLGTILAFTLFLSGMMIIGPVNGSLIASIEPISAVIFAVTIMGESFGKIDVLGIIFIIIAITLITLKDKLHLSAKTKPAKEVEANLQTAKQLSKAPISH
ncbi:Threonine/homoserine efflux transporter RhtA [Granulicatella balaenopterae]|uniref:Threonine/homoserine efflux transporter RhtA n=1 Tax=Granulicatella balaenopterae TaxID=137733 RepID=A0A1H9JVA3_9LACT|nr:DMT family transporter [Granulicatella balaenopterae]SEQ90707.1 Threonine/homoserine efflux transporter RhtA [Granulicatella balaenopterae]